MLSNIRIVLVNPSHPGNIGAVARAMKNMGLYQLTLVQPKKFPDQEAMTFASHATDILEQAVVTNSLDEAIQGCHFVYGTSARFREFSKLVLTSREAAIQIIDEHDHSDIAILFGRERTGLLNEEILKCQYQIFIPSVEEYSSLNLAAAVQVMCYELRMTQLVSQGETHLNQQQGKEATSEELEGLYQHIQEAMISIGFLKPANPRRLMQRIRRIFARSSLDKNDVDLLRGMMSAVRKKTILDLGGQE